MYLQVDSPVIRLFTIKGSTITPVVTANLDPSTTFGAHALAIIEATFPSTFPSAPSEARGRQLQLPTIECTDTNPCVFYYTGDQLCAAGYYVENYIGGSSLCVPCPAGLVSPYPSLATSCRAPSLDEVCYPYSQGYLGGGSDVTSLPIGALYTYVDAVAACNSNLACAGFTMQAPATANGGPPVGSVNTWFKTNADTTVYSSPDWSSYVVASNCCAGQVFVANVDPKNYYACGAPFDYNSCCSCAGGDGVNYGDCVNSRAGPCARPPKPFDAFQWCLAKCDYPGSWCYFP